MLWIPKCRCTIYLR
uniref:Uncharacterized protein n=1 Tax=Lepeophtheirus salmonis TaxID=72036 RepID=A0A0K2U3J5_LEPSM